MYSVISADQGSLMEQDVGTLYLNSKLLDHTRRTTSGREKFSSRMNVGQTSRNQVK